MPGNGRQRYYYNAKLVINLIVYINYYDYTVFCHESLSSEK